MSSPEEKIRALQRKKSNKECFECTARGPRYICLDFGTFVCEQCSGILRQYSYRVMGIGMSTFTDDDVAKIHGNHAAAKIWLATWNPDKFPKPNDGDISAIKTFVERKYIEKKWNAPQGHAVRPKASQHSATYASKSRSSHPPSVAQSNFDTGDEWEDFDALAEPGQQKRTHSHTSQRPPIQNSAPRSSQPRQQDPKPHAASDMFDLFDTPANDQSAQQPQRSAQQSQQPFQQPQRPAQQSQQPPQQPQRSAALSPPKRNANVVQPASQGSNFDTGDDWTTFDEPAAVSSSAADAEWTSFGETAGFDFDAEQPEQSDQKDLQNISFDVQPSAGNNLAKANAAPAKKAPVDVFSAFEDLVESMPQQGAPVNNATQVPNNQYQGGYPGPNNGAPQGSFPYPQPNMYQQHQQPGLPPQHPNPYQQHALNPYQSPQNQQFPTPYQQAPYPQQPQNSYQQMPQVQQGRNPYQEVPYPQHQNPYAQTPQSYPQPGVQPYEGFAGGNANAPGASGAPGFPGNMYGMPYGGSGDNMSTGVHQFNGPSGGPTSTPERATNTSQAYKPSPADMFAGAGPRARNYGPNSPPLTQSEYATQVTKPDRPDPFADLGADIGSSLPTTSTNGRGNGHSTPAKGQSEPADYMGSFNDSTPSYNTDGTTTSFPAQVAPPYSSENPFDGFQAGSKPSAQPHTHNDAIKPVQPTAAADDDENPFDMF